MYKNVDLLIVDDDPAINKVFEKIAKDNAWSCKVATDGTKALEILNQAVIEVAIVDIKLPGFTGMQILEYVKKNNLTTEVIIVTGVGSVETAINAIKMGAYDYLTKPFDDINKVTIQIEKAMEKFRLIQKVRRLERKSPEKHVYEEIVGKSKRIQEVFDVIDTISGTSSTVLILGESGTGKEMVAKAIHRRSKRSDKQFVVINCSAIPETLLESELFGHKKGSFTGAIKDKPGLFEEADEGSIFLDEIGEISPMLQVKLLRVLQNGEVRSVGGVRNRFVDVRVIAATNKDLYREVQEGNFREDLYYRLNVITLVLPPLRDRVEDIPLLAYHFLKKYSKKIGKKIEKISVDTLQSLQNYRWVGNVRELENVIERAVVLATQDSLQATDLPPRVLGDSFYLTDEQSDAVLSQFGYQEAKEKALASFNRSYLTNLLRQSRGNLSSAADKAGMDRSNFKKIVKKFGINFADYKEK
jgi:two-component system response regulator HydG